MKISKIATIMAATAFATASWAEDVTLEFWTWYPSEAVLNSVIDAFEAENPGIEVNLNLFESTAYQDRMPLSLASEDPMDVVAVQTSTMVNQVKDSLTPLAPLYQTVTGNDITTVLNPTMLDQARSLADDGELYIAPLGALGSVAVYYNMDILDELGLAIPTNRAELANMVATVNEQKPDTLPISFTGANWFIDEITDNIAEQVQPGFFNSVRYDEGGSWNSDSYKEAFNTIVGLYNDGIFSKDTLDLDYGRAAELFQQGQAAAYIQGTWDNGLLSAPFREANSIPLTNVGASPLPVMVDGKDYAIRGFIEVGLGVAGHSEHPEEAAKFIEFVTSGGGVDKWADTLFVVPSKQGYELPDNVFSTEVSKSSYEAIAAQLQNPTSDRNNVSDFAAVKGDVIIDSILNGTGTDEQVEHLQSEWESGRYSNAQ